MTVTTFTKILKPLKLLLPQLTQVKRQKGSRPGRTPDKEAQMFTASMSEKVRQEYPASCGQTGQKYRHMKMMMNKQMMKAHQHQSLLGLMNFSLHFKVKQTTHIHSNNAKI